MTDWHASADLVARYTDGTLPEPDAWSLEKHLERCGTCAGRVSRAARDTSAAAVLAEVRDAVLQAAPVPHPARETAPTALRPAGDTTPAAAPFPATPTASPSPATLTASPSPATLTAPPSPATPTATSSPATPTTSPSPATPTTSPSPATQTTSPSPATPTTPPSPATQTTSPSPATSTTPPSPATPTAPNPAPATAPASARQPSRTPAATPSVLLARVRHRAFRRAAVSSSGPHRGGTPLAPHPVRSARPRPARLYVGSRPARVLWAAGPAVRGAWLPAVLLVAVGAVALAYGAGFAGARPLLLAVAPVVPVAGVALSYGAHADPLHEIAAATPSAGLRLLLTRTAAVLAVSLPLLTVAGLMLPASGAPGAAAWLLPGLALTLASLALAGYVGCRTATAVTGGGWLCAVLAPALAAPGDRLTARLAQQLSTYLDGAPAQGAWATAAVLSAVLLAARRPAYDRLERP